MARHSAFLRSCVHSGIPAFRHFGILLLLSALHAAEPLVCRGLPAGIAVDAIASRSGHPLRLAPGMEKTREHAIWFALVDDRLPTAAQALAHTLGCWWRQDEDGLVHLGPIPGPTPGRPSVRVYTSPILGRPEEEDLVRRLMAPWLGGAGGLVLEPATGTWTATLDAAGQARLVDLLTLLGSGEPRATHLLPDPDDPGPARPFATAPAGTTLGAWAVDLGRVSGLAVALGPELDPAAPAPEGAIASLGEAERVLAAKGLHAGIFHGCLCIGAKPADLLDPAERRTLALVPVGHLCRNAADFVRLASALTRRVRPGDWTQPGWAIVPRPSSRGLLLAADVPAIHDVLAAIEGADAAGLEQWLGAAVP